MTDQQWRASVRADAIRMGYPPAVADYLAAQVGKQPTDAERKCFAPRSWLAGLNMSASNPRTTDERRQCIAEMFGATALVPDLAAAATPLRHVVAMLTDATGSARSITPGGIERVRVQLLQRGAAA